MVDIKYPIDPNVDYRIPQNRGYLMKAWVEANAITQEHNQQIRLILSAIDEMDLFENKVESKLWAAFLWGCCYNLVSPWAILTNYPLPPRGDEEFQKFSDWYNETFDIHRFDTDCRYRKAKMLACVKSFFNQLGDLTITQMVEQLVKPEQTETDNFERIWDFSMSVNYFGRLSCWNFVEAVTIATDWKYPLDAPSFMMEDLSNSESNRNGICFLINREDLLTKHCTFKNKEGRITKDDAKVLEEAAEAMFQQCKAEFNHITPITRLNAETTVCCWFKKMFRNYNTRYIGWDAERTLAEIEYLEEHWPDVDTKPIRTARLTYLPESLLGECNGQHGVQKWKMPDFFDSGTPNHILKFQLDEVWMPPAGTKKAKQNKPKTTAKKLW